MSSGEQARYQTISHLPGSKEISMIYLTGDTHGLTDIAPVREYFKNGHDPDGRKVTKNDYLIILGDVGVCWDGLWHDIKVTRELHSVPATVLWIDGNHENYDLIDELPVTDDWHGGKVQYVTDDIIHLMRGQIYAIEGSTFFTFGGGNSIDRMYRQTGVSWWPQEMPTMAEYEEGTMNLEKVDYRVDYILTHSCPQTIGRQLVTMIYPGEEELQRYFEFIANEAEFRDWYFGHWHVERDIG